MAHSKHFEDIEGMKQILRYLVSSMADMTAKIDTMQNAIDFMNKTFHTTHQPFLRFEETLENMTISLGNLNQNLRDINATLASFKKFLRQFENTVFNIDDVMAYIDESLNHLNKAANFVEYSLYDLNGTSKGVNGDHVDALALTFVNKSVLDVDYTSKYSNETLESMQYILTSLENAVRRLNSRIDNVIGDSDILTVSLKNINVTVLNTLQKLNKLYSNLETLNSTVDVISATTKKLNETYRNINNTLKSMNEPYMFLNGTILDVINKLQMVDGSLADISGNLNGLKSNMTNMNSSLIGAMDWIKGMVKKLNDFHLHFQKDKHELVVSVKDKDILQTLGMLLEMNGTLSKVDRDVDNINDELDRVSHLIEKFGNSLSSLDQTLDGIDSSFKLIDSTIVVVNATMDDTVKSLKKLDDASTHADKKLEEIEVTFGSVNQTLNTVENILNNINKTNNNVMDNLSSLDKTFADLRNTTRSSLASSSKLQTTLQNLNGTTYEMSQKVYNANETLRVLKSKADIVTESFNMLNNTLNSLNNSVLEMIDQLQLTDTLMDKTKETLVSANHSLRFVEKSQERLNDTLTKLVANFDKMVDEFDNIGTAFPNMKSTIRQTKAVILKLKEKLNATFIQVQNQSVTNILLNKKYFSLDDGLRKMDEKVNLSKNIISVLEHISKGTRKDIDELNESVREVSELFDHVSGKFDYVNATHEILKHRYTNISRSKEQVKEELLTIASLLPSVHKNLTDIMMLQNRYSNIDNPFPQLKDTFGELLLTLLSQNDTFKNSEGEFERVQNTLWNSNGHPTQLHGTLQELKNKTQHVNDTVNSMEVSLNNVYATHLLTKQMAGKLMDLIDKAKIIQANVGDIEDEENNVRRNITTTNTKVQNTKDILENLLENLGRKLNKVQVLKRVYGNVNGTFDNHDIYDEMKNTLSKLVDDVTRQLQNLNSNATLLQKVIKENDEAYGNYSGQVIDLNDDGINFVELTLKKIRDVSDFIGSKQDDFDGILSDTHTLNNTVEDVFRTIDRLQDTLKYKSNKVSFISKHEPLIKKWINESLISLNKTIDVKSDISTQIKELLIFATEIESKARIHDNVNMSVKVEEQELTKMKGDSEAMKEKLIVAKQMSEKLIADVDALDMHNTSLDDIKEKYEHFRNKLSAHTNLIAEAKLLSSDMQDDVNTIRHTFNDLNSQLDDVEFTATLINEANEFEKLIIEVKTNISNELNAAHENTRWLRREFDNIKKTYGNLSATDIDLENSFIIGALEAHTQQVDMLSESFLNNQSEYFVQSGLLKDSVLIFNDTKFYRDNINNIISDQIKPTVTGVLENFTSLNDFFQDIKRRLKRIDIAFRGLNETIHATNLQLFKDKQKLFLADTMFPDLLEDQATAKSSLNETRILLAKSQEELSSVFDVYNKVAKRMESHPNIDLPLADILETLREYNRTLRQISRDLERDHTSLQNISKEMYKEEGERYGDDESVETIKKRYDTLHEQLHELIRNISKSEHLIADTRNGSKVANAKLDNINTTLDELHRTSEMLNTLLTSFDNLDDKKNRLNQLFEISVENNIKLGRRFNDTANRFKHINRTVFEDNMVPFNKSYIILQDDIAHIGSDLDVLHRDIKRATNRIENMQKIKQDYIGDLSALTDILDNSRHLINNLTHERAKIDEQLNTSTDESGNLKLELYKLNDELNNITSTFIYQEKLEYFEENSPENVYKRISKAIDETATLNKRVSRVFDSTNKSFASMLGQMVSVENFKFNTDTLRDSNKDVKEIIDDHDGRIESIINTFQQLSTYLFAPDGKDVSDDENIDAMKGRFNKTLETLSEIETELSDIQRTSTELNKTLSKNQADTDFIVGVINQHHAVKKEIVSLIESSQNFAPTIKESANNLLNNNDENDNAGNTYTRLQASYNATNNDVISDLKTSISNDLTSLQHRLSEQNELSSDLGKQYKNISSRLEQYLNDISIDMQHPEDVKTMLDTFNDLGPQLHDHLSAVKELESNLRSNGKVIASDIMDINRNIDNLEKEFKEQEKQDYIDQIMPVLQEMYTDLLQKAGEIEGTYDSTNMKTNKTRETIQKVLEIMDTDDAIDIKQIQDVVVSLNGITSMIKDADNSFRDATNLITSMNSGLFKPYGDFFDASNTIEEIKVAFDALNKTLLSAASVYNEVSDKLLQSGNNADDLETLPKEVIKKYEDLRTVKEKASIITKQYDNMASNVTKVQTDSVLIHKSVEQLDTLINHIEQRFVGVKDKELTQQLDTHRDVLDELAQSAKTISKSSQRVNSTFSNGLKTLDKVDTIMQNTSMSLKDMKEKEGNSNVLLNVVDTSLDDLRNLTEQISSNSQKTLEEASRLHDKLKNLEIDFLRMEKEEFYSQHFPSKLFEDVKNILEDIQDSRDQHSAKLTKTKQNLNDLSNRVTSYGNTTLVSTIYELQTSFSHFNSSFQSHSDELLNKLSLWENIKSKAVAPNGDNVSDDETIDDLKARLQSMKEGLDNVDGFVKNMSTDIQNGSKEMQTMVDTINQSGNLLDKTDFVKQAMKELIQNVSTKRQFVEEKNIDHDKASSTFSTFHVEHEALLKRFNSTINTNITLLKHQAGALLNSISNHILTMKEDLNNANNLTLNAEREVSEYEQDLNKILKSNNELKTVLDAFPEVNTSTSDAIVKLNAYQQATNSEMSQIDLKLQQFKDTIQKLEKEFRRQEKEDYFNKNNPRDEYEKLQSKIEQIDALNTNQSLALTELTNATDIVINLMNISNHVQIEMSNVTAFLSKLNTSTVKGFEFISSMNDLYSENERFLLSPDGQNVSDEETIEDMKKRMKNVWSILKYMNNSLDEQMYDMTKTLNDSVLFNEMLRRMEEELKEHNHLSNRVDELVRDGKNLTDLSRQSDDDISSSAFKIRIVKSNFVDVQYKYRNVKDGALQAEADEIAKNLTDLAEKQITLEADLAPVFQKANTIRSDLHYLQINANKSTNTLDSLVNKNKRVNDQVKETENKTTFVAEGLGNSIPALQNHLERLKDLETQIHNLKGKFKRQQIYEYIKENFPQILMEYEKLNESISDINNKIYPIIDGFNDLNSTIHTVREKMDDYPTIKIDVESSDNQTKLEKEKLRESITAVNKLMRKVARIERTLSSQSMSHESFNDIKDRFNGYGEMINTLAEDIRNVSQDLQPLEVYVNGTQLDMNNYNDALDKYANLKELLQIMKEMIENYQTEQGKLFNVFNISKDIADKVAANTSSMSKRFADLLPSAYTKSIKTLSDRIAQESNGLDQLQTTVDDLLLKLQLSVENISKADDMLSDTIDSKPKLDITNSAVETILASVNSTLQNMRPSLRTINQPILNINNAVNDISKEIETLNKALLNQEKDEFVSRHRPGLKRKSYIIRENIETADDQRQATTKFHENVNDQLQSVDALMGSIPNIFIPFNTLFNNVSAIGLNIARYTLQLKSMNESSLEVAASDPFTRDNWTLSTIDSIRIMFNDTKQNITLIGDTTAFINDSLKVLINESEQILSDISFHKQLFDKFIDIKASSVRAGTNLVKLNTNLENTEQYLERVHEKLNKNRKRLADLTKQYAGVESDEIIKYSERTRSILEDIVGLRIPLANRLFTKRIIENYNIVNNRFEDMVLTLNETYTDKGTLEYILGEVDDSLLNITLETESIGVSDVAYMNDAVKMMEQLNRSDELLDALASVSFEQKKEDILKMSMPDLQSVWKRLNEELKQLKTKLQDQNSTLLDKQAFANSLQDRINSMPSVNISVINEESNLKALSDKTHNLLELLEVKNESLQIVDVFNINITDIRLNSSVDVATVKSMISKLEDSLLEIDMFTNTTRAGMTVSENSISEISDELSKLNMTLSCFKKVENKLRESTEHQEILTTFMVAVDNASTNSENKLTILSKSLQTLLSRYSEFPYDISNPRRLIDSANETIKMLFDKLSRVRDRLISTDSTLKTAKLNLYEYEDDMEYLNATLVQIKFNLLNVEEEHGQINDSLTQLQNEIPDLNIAIADLQFSIDKMNKTLENEFQKLTLQSNTLPVLQKRYETVNLTLTLTNATLQKLATDIVSLTNYVNKLKERMDMFQTINISSADIESNITHLENRLAIMLDHYKNTEEVVGILKKTLESHDVEGHNISATSVQSEYEDMNKTLHQVEEALSKIELDGFALDDHITGLNTTMRNTNAAIDEFVEKVMSTNIIKDTINDLGQQIVSSKDHVRQINKNVKNMTTYYEDMQNKYQRVLDTVEENNTIVGDLLKAAAENAKALEDIILSLEHQYNGSLDDFMKMNTTLYQDIETYIDLKETLNAVEQMEKKLEATLEELEKGIRNATSSSSGMTASLQKLNELMNNLNDSLNLEQMKYDFLKEHLNKLDSRLNGMMNPLSKTNSAINDGIAAVDNADKTTKEALDKMKQFPNIDISLDTQWQTINTARVTLHDSTENHKDIEGRYKDVKAMAGGLTDALKNITEVRTLYDEVNKTLDNIEDTLTDIATVLQTTSNESFTLANDMTKLSDAIDYFEEMNTRADTTSRNVSNTTQAVQNTSKTLSKINDTISQLKTELEDMKTMYSSVDDPVLQKKLADTIKDFKKKIIIQENIQSMFRNMSDNLEYAKQTLTSANDNLQAPVNSFDKLTQVNNQTNQLLQTTQSSIQDINVLNAQIISQAEDFNNSLEVLRNEMRQIDSTLNEEKRKREFIKTQFPLMQSVLATVTEDLASSTDNINRLDRTINSSSKGLDDVKRRLDGLEELQIPLTDETNTLTQLQNDIVTGKGNLNNVKQILDGLDLEALQNVNLSFSELQKLYEAFENATNKAKETITTVTQSSEDIDSTNNKVSDILVDLDDTIDNFVKMENLLNVTTLNSQQLNEKIAITNNSIHTMSNDLANIESLFSSVLLEFVHITDPNILNAKQVLTKMLNDQKQQMKDLMTSQEGVHADNALVNSNMSSINQTLSSTKALIQQLKDHIAYANTTSAATILAINNTGKAHDDLNTTASALSPDIQRLLRKIMNLQDDMKKEQDKLDFITQNKPSVLKTFDDLQSVFEETNKNLSKTDFYLAKLKEQITTTGEKLANHDTLDITTEVEMTEWNSLESTNKDLYKHFAVLSDLYKQVSAMIANIDSRDGTIHAVENRFQNITQALANISTKLKEMNANMVVIKADGSKVNETLQKLQETVKIFELLQTSVTFSENKIATAKLLSTEISANLQKTNKTTTSIGLLLQKMSTDYQPLNNKDWETKYPRYMTSFDAIKNLRRQKHVTFDPLQGKVNFLEESLNKLAERLKSEKLTRASAVPVINEMQASVKNINETMTKTSPELTKLQLETEDTKTDAVNLEIEINKLNESLLKELEKFNFIQSVLKPTQNKYTVTNETFVKNSPNVQDMVAKVKELARIIEKIKTKLADFGLQDSDNSVKQWEDQLKTLNNSVASIVSNNKITEEKLVDLRTTLWSEAPMYSEPEDITKLRSRFTGYNKTLDEIEGERI